MSEPAPIADAPASVDPVARLSPVARAAIRGLALGAVITAILESIALLFTIVGPTSSSLAGKIVVAFVLLVLGVVTGLIFAPLAWVEIVFAARPPSSARDRRAAIATFALALACLVVAFLELVYLNFGFADPVRGLQHVWGEIRGFLRFTEATALGVFVLFALALPFAPIARSRIRGESLRRQIVGSLLTCFVAWPAFGAFVAIFIRARTSYRESAAAALAIGFALALFLPLVYRVADVVERRVAARLARDAE